MKNKIGNRIKQLRLAKGYTQKDVAHYLGVQTATVNRYETGIITNLKQATIAKLSELFDVSPAYIMGLEEDLAAYDNISEAPGVYLVPLIGTIACGTPIEAIQDTSGEQVPVDARYHCDFALRCKGDSMINARIFDGDVVYIKAQPDVENGEIAAVLINNEATLKRVYYYEHRLELRPENPLFPVLNYDDSNRDEIRVIGKAIAFSSLVR